MSAPDSARRIHIAAALIHRADGMVLLVRKRGTGAFMQPGGKLEPGETAGTALLRELKEELRFSGAIGAPVPLGRFSAPAAHEADTVVEADVFAVLVSGEASPQAEIEELRWIDPRRPGDIDLAALTRDHILPEWVARFSR
jgi:8-oxo-dGTP diphosphatase